MLLNQDGIKKYIKIMVNMKSIIKYFNEMKGFKYWMAHMAIALIISGAFMVIGVVSLPFVGAIFYLSREVAQYEDKGYFDWMGFIMPLLACILLAWMF